MRPLGGLGKVYLQSRSGKESPGLGTGGAGLGNRKDQRAHLQVGDKGTEAQRPGPQTGACQRSQCGGITREGAGSTAASSSLSSVSVHRTSPNTGVVPMFAEHLPQGTTLRASCPSSLRILPATVREATGLQVKEQPRWCGRSWRSTRWASPPGCPSGRPLPCALPLPSRHLTG